MTLNEAYKQVCDALDRGNAIFQEPVDSNSALLNTYEAVTKFSIAIRCRKDQNEIERRAMNMIIGIFNAMYRSNKIDNPEHCLEIRLQELQKQCEEEQCSTPSNSLGGDPS